MIEREQACSVQAGCSSIVFLPMFFLELAASCGQQPACLMGRRESQWVLSLLCSGQGWGR